MNRQQRRHQERQARKETVSGGWSVVRVHQSGRETVEASELSEAGVLAVGEQLRATLHPGESLSLRGPLVFDFD